jgi:hypothetical protein
VDVGIPCGRMIGIMKGHKCIIVEEISVDNFERLTPPLPRKGIKTIVLINVRNLFQCQVDWIQSQVGLLEKAAGHMEVGKIIQLCTQEKVMEEGGAKVLRF